ncbi:MAG TPA: hypothetical protein VE869_15585 [Gemmatimonas sp.]|nr:hypothetical protein [Gemmatimonas sp.]
MPAGPRAYLLDRFRSDAAALRQRVDALHAAARTSSALPGPDAPTSMGMAAACDDVVAMLESIPDGPDPAALLSSIAALSPLLDARAKREVASPAVRAVYAGAATRIREVQQVEATARNLLA